MAPGGLRQRGESIAEAIATLKERGVTGEQAAELLKGLDVELVLTAHPTETRRRTILSKLQRIAGQVQLLNRPDALPRELQRRPAGLSMPRLPACG